MKRRLWYLSIRSNQPNYIVLIHSVDWLVSPWLVFVLYPLCYINDRFNRRQLREHVSFKTTVSIIFERKAEKKGRRENDLQSVVDP